MMEMYASSGVGQVGSFSDSIDEDDSVETRNPMTLSEIKSKSTKRAVFGKPVSSFSLTSKALLADLWCFSFCGTESRKKFEKFQALMEVLLGVFNIINFILKTYDSNSEEVRYVEMGVNIYFAGTYLLMFLFSESGGKQRFVYAPVYFCDIISWSSSLWCTIYPEVQALPLTFLRVIVIKQVVFKHVKVETVQMQILTSVLNLLILLFVFASIITIIEAVGDPFWLESTMTDSHLTLLEACYFIMVTISTVGYGDVSAQTVLGRLCIIFFILGGILFFSTETGRILAIISVKNSGNGNAIVVNENSRILLLAGRMDSVFLTQFLTELYSEDHLNAEGDEEDVPPTCIILDINWSEDMKELCVSDNTWKKWVQYLRGSVFDANDLFRAKAHIAQDIFVYTDLSVEGADEDSVMRVLALRKKYPAIIPKVVVGNSSCSEILVAAGLSEKSICPNDMLQFGILAQNCLCPGSSTLLQNLMQSISGDTDPRDPQWYKEYMEGAGREIYQIELPARFHGMSFKEAALTIYRETNGCLLFSLHRQDPAGSKMYFNINEFDDTLKNTICEFDEAFIIAEDSKDLLLYKVQDSGGKKMLRRASSFVGSRMGGNLLSPNQSRAVSMSYLDSSKSEKSLGKNRHWLDPTHHSFSLKELVPRSGNLKNHILLCGDGDKVDDVALFLYSYEACGGSQDIVVLAQDDPTETWWPTVAGCKKMFFIKGNPSSYNDMIRANAAKASTIIVLGNTGGSEGGDLVDSNALYVTILAELICNNIPSDGDFSTNCENIVTLLRQPETASFLQIVDRNMYLRKEAEKLARRKLQKKQQSIMSNLVPGMLIPSRRQKKDYNSTKVPSRYAAGHIVSNSIPGPLMANSYYNPMIIKVLRYLCSSDTKSTIRLIEVGDVTMKDGSPLTYGQMVEDLILHGRSGVAGAGVPLGLYRLRDDSDRDETLPYVYTNPFPATQLKASDQVFILCENVTESPTRRHTGRANRNLSVDETAAPAFTKKKASMMANPDFATSMPDIGLKKTAI
jgi:hypothetical protein